MSRIGAINAGSSSIKFSVFEADKDAVLLLSGQVDGIGVAPRLRVRNPSGQTLAERQWEREALDHTAAIFEILGTARHLMNGVAVSAVGHRVVHGGTDFQGPVRVTKDLLSALEKLIPLAPLHEPHNITPMRAILEAAPDLPQVACFDTAFHRVQPRLAQTFAIPRALTTSGIYRYGFHGLSYEYLTSRLQQIAPDLAKGRVVMAHLGNGASLCAVRNGRSVASTMGFTAVDGLMMGTRCGAIDPGVLLYLMQEHKMNETALEDLIYRKSGLLGVSGISSDMRTLRTSPEPAAREAIDLFVYRIVREIGSLAAAAGGIDALVFAGGIGENDPSTRAEVVAGCSWLGATLNPERNAQGAGVISGDDSRLAVLVVPTDEELMIARHTMAVLAGREEG